jgi:hypothetical protein
MGAGAVFVVTLAFSAAAQPPPPAQAQPAPAPEQTTPAAPAPGTPAPAQPAPGSTAQPPPAGQPAPAAAQPGVQPGQGYPPPGYGYPPPGYGYPPPGYGYPPPGYGYPPPGYGYPPPGGAYEQPPAPPPPGPDLTIHRHDGFYLRLALGGTYVWDSVRIEDRSMKFSMRGGGMSMEVAVGGTPAPGVVVGGGLYSSTTTALNVTEVKQYGDRVEGADGDFNATTFMLLGPMVDVFLDPNSGFHLQAAFGIGAISLGDGDSRFSTTDQYGYPMDERREINESTYSGLGVMLGTGYEFWVGEQWGVGALARLVYISASSDDSESGDNVDVVPFGGGGAAEWDHSAIMPSLLFSATLH